MNYSTQNAKIETITEKALIAGMDAGSEIHYAGAFDWRGYEYSKKAFLFSNTEAGFVSLLKWMQNIANDNGKEEFMPGMEPAGHYWFDPGKFLQDNDIKPVLVNPYHVKQSKELDGNNPTKNDRKHPKVIAGLIKDGRFSYQYLPERIYAELRNASNLRFQTQEELTRVMNRISRWFSIYFPEYKDVYGNSDAKSGMMVLQQAPLPADIKVSGVDGVNKIWRDAKLRGAGMKRAQKLVEAAEHSIGSREGLTTARMEIKNLLADYERYSERMDELADLMDGLIREIPYEDKVLRIKGIGIKTISGFAAETGHIRRFDNPKQIQKLAGYALVEESSGKHQGESWISRRGRKHLRYLLFEALLSLASKNEEFKELHYYYTHREENPLKKNQPFAAVSCKFLRTAYKILTTGADYDGTKMMNDMKRPQKQMLQGA